LNRRIVTYAALCTLLAARGILPQDSLSAQQEVTIVESAGSVEVTYRPLIDTPVMTSGSTEYTRFVFGGGAHDGNPGEPVVPYRNFMIAIPEGARPQLRIVNADYRTIRNVTAENAPGTAAADSVFSVDRWISGEPAGFGQAGYFRMQRVFSFRMYPVQYNPGRSEARLANSITVRIDFNTAGPVPSAGRVRPADTEADRMYEALLLNHATGKTWRKNPQRATLRKSGGLSGGLWYTIPVREEGIYKITYQDLVNYGIEPSSVTPRTIRIMNNGGTMLPEGIDDPRPDGLIENAILVAGGEDGSFDQGDYILFYGRGVDSWVWYSDRQDIRHTKNVFAVANLYWFTYGGADGKRMRVQPYAGTGASPLTTGRAVTYREDEVVKMFESGSNWFTAEVTPDISKSYSVRLSGYVPDSEAKLRVSVYTITPYPYIYIGQHELETTIDGQTFMTSNIPGSIPNLVLRQSGTLPASGEFTVAFDNNTSNSLSSLYLDWYEFEYTRDLVMRDGTLKFQAPVMSGTAEFLVSGVTDPQTIIFNITDFDNVFSIDYTYSSESNTASFSDTLRREDQQYYAAEPGSYRAISNMTPVPNSFLKSESRSADMIIIAPREFAEAAVPLEQFHETRHGLMTEVVVLDEIFNEFGAGLRDPVAIRDFMKFAFGNWVDGSMNPPRYLLLFGDGNFDYTGIRSDSEANRVPPFEVNSTNALVTRAVDDFYGYVSGNDRFVDVAVGRLPVKTVGMAGDLVDKIVTYDTEPEYGSWRNTVTFVADDEITPYSDIEDIHTDQTESLARADYMPEFLDQAKIYLMEYQAVPDVTSASDRKPDAQDDLVNQINTGSRIITYVGHGNHRLLAHEWVLNREVDMPRIDNGNRQFFFYIASCAFGRWDFRNEDSMAELLLTEPDRGAIGLISSSRDVFAHSNYTLANEFFRNLYKETRTTATVGEALQVAKVLVAGENSEKFQLLGDPAFRFEFPKDMITGMHMEPDSLKAMAEVTVAASVADGASFAGNAFLSVFDSKKQGVHTMANGVEKNYVLPGSGIFRGSADIKPEDGGHLTMKLIVPKDITYGGDDGRVSLYVWNEDGDGSAYLGNIPVGGTAEGMTDTDGPELQMYFNDRIFVSGDYVAENPELLLKLSDPQGINITGEVGHKIELALGEDTRVIDLSPFFNYDSGSYTQGAIRYRLTGLSAGDNTITIRAWDNFNNSSMLRAIVKVVSGENLFVENVFNYPNPFSEETQFTCQVSVPAEIEIKIFTVAGRLVKTISGMQSGDSSFFVSPSWDGRDEDGDRLANGTYLYKLIARTFSAGEMQQVEKISKIVIMR